MKFAVLTLAAALSAAAVAPAQAQQAPGSQRPRAEARGERMDPAKRVERRVQMLTEHLALTADQAAKVKTILTQEGEQLKAFFEKNRPAQDAQRPSDEQRAAFRQQMQRIREQSNAEIAKVLNADQLKKYEEFRQRRGRHEGRKLRD